jgi:hypothetical protein
MNTQKKRGPLEVSDERFEKTPWTSLTPQGARQGRVPSSKASNLKERHSPLQRSSSRRELFEGELIRDTTFGVGMALWVFFWRYRENGQNRKGKTVGHVFDRDRLGCR